MNFGKTTSIIISGSAFLYLIAQSTKYLSSRVKIERQIKSSEDIDNSHCCICQTCDTEKVDKSTNQFVTCKGCGALVCPKTCSEFLNEVWECFRCKKNRIIQQRTGEWFLKQLQDFSTFSFQMALGEDILNLQNEGGNKIIISRVRELIEKCLIKILNGTDLDATPIDRISDKAEYLPNSSGSINSDYVELKRFINRICQEVINITDTLEFSENASLPKAPFDPQTYEELLATAVLNKITSDYLHRKKHGMNHEIEAERDFENVEDEDFNFYDKVHLNKIQSHKISLPDLLNEFDSSVEDDPSNDNNSGSWEENWSMKKYGSDKISMLIPSPTYEIKTKIGDVDIDELSDSSNKDSNYLDEELYDEDIIIQKTDDIQDENEEVVEDVPRPKSFATISKESNIIKSTSQLDVDENEYMENEALFNDISGLSTSENRKYIDEVFEQILITESTNDNDKKVPKADEKVPKIGVKIPKADEKVPKAYEKVPIVNEKVPKVNVKVPKADEKVQKAKEKVSNVEEKAPKDVKVPTAEENALKVHEMVSKTDEVVPKVEISDSIKIVKKEVLESPSTERPSSNSVDEVQVKYKSPLLTQYLTKPIQPIKVADALKIASSQSVEKTKEETPMEVVSPKVVDEKPLLSPLLLKKVDVTKKFDEESGNDDEVNTPPIKGSIAEREHLKWLKAIPIENNPYSPEALHKRLSRSQDKFIDVQHVDGKVIESAPSSDFDELQLREDITKYKRDYYINHKSISTESIHKPKEEVASNENSSIEVDYSGDQVNDSSLTVSDDSLTRIYTLSSRETTIIHPTTPRVSISLSNDNDEQETKHDKVEEDIPLPSVKKLAEFYASPSNITDSNAKQHEPMDIPAGISKSTSKRYELSDVPAKPIASITARTLPPKIKEDLKRSLHPDDNLPIIRHNERNVSPDIQRGMTRSSIAYFENFYK